MMLLTGHSRDMDAPVADVKCCDRAGGRAWTYLYNSLILTALMLAVALF